MEIISLMKVSPESMVGLKRIVTVLEEKGFVLTIKDALRIWYSAAQKFDFEYTPSNHTDYTDDQLYEFLRYESYYEQSRGGFIIEQW